MKKLDQIKLWEFCPLFCMCVKYGLFTLRDEHRLGAIENKVLRKKDLRGRKCWEAGRD